MKPVTRLILGDWVPAKTEFLKMSVTTKECAVAAALLLGHDLGSVAIRKHCQKCCKGLIGEIVKL